MGKTVRYSQFSRAQRKVISATIKMILATDEVLTATLKVISVTTTVILATEEVISATLKVISASTNLGH